MDSLENTGVAPLSRQYTLAIDTIPLPENPSERMKVIVSAVAPVLSHIVADVTAMAIGSWPTPEEPFNVDHVDRAMAEGLRAVGRGLRGLPPDQMASVAAIVAMTRVATLIEGLGMSDRGLAAFWTEFTELCPPLPSDTMQRFGDCRHHDLAYAVGMARCEDEGKSERECERENFGALQAAADCRLEQLEELNKFLERIPGHDWPEPPIPRPVEDRPA